MVFPSFFNRLSFDAKWYICVLILNNYEKHFNEIVILRIHISYSIFL